MKFFKGLNYMKKRLILYIMVIPFVLAVIYIVSGISTTLYLHMMGIVEISIFDLIFTMGGAGILGGKTMFIPTILLFMVLVVKRVGAHNSPCVVVREKSREFIWKSKTKIIVVTAFIYSIVVVLEAYLISGFMVGSFSNSWSQKRGLIALCFEDPGMIEKINPYFLKTSTVLLLAFLGIFLGLTAVGMIMVALNLKISIKYAIIPLISSFIYETTSVGSSYSLIIEKMIVNPANFAHIELVIAKLMSLALMSIVSYILGRRIIENKDFIYIKKL